MQHGLDYEVLLKKKMHRAERYQNWIYIPAKIRNEFPPGEIVTIKAGKKRIRMKINAFGYMNPATALWEEFTKSINFDKEHDTLVFIKHKDGTLEISTEKK